MAKTLWFVETVVLVHGRCFVTLLFESQLTKEFKLLTPLPI